MLTPEDITKALELTRHCLTDTEILDKLTFELNTEEKELVELKERIQQYLLQ